MNESQVMALGECVDKLTKDGGKVMFRDVLMLFNDFNELLSLQELHDDAGVWHRMDFILCLPKHSVHEHCLQLNKAREMSKLL
jgi:hypothetical protein